MKRILVVGSGGREQAIAWALAHSPEIEQIFLAPGNAGTHFLPGRCENVSIMATDIEGLLSFAKTKSIDLTIVGPEQPLEQGIVDRFEAVGMKCFGPTKAAAQLETSKAFAKAVMKQAGIPTAAYAVFSELPLAKAFVMAQDTYPIVLKASGLASGKGVIIAQSREEALASLEYFFVEKRLGDAANEVVIESFLSGEEASIFLLCDGEEYVFLPSAQDHKRIGEGDTGKNTGGMGAYSPAPIVTEAVLAKVKETIADPLMRYMKDNEMPYRGFLYIGVMIDSAGHPFVVEFNARLGDPETQVILPLLKTPLLELIESAFSKTVKSRPVDISDKHAITVIMASSGYPDHYQTGKAIAGQCHFEGENCKLDINGKILIFHSGTRFEGHKLLTAGGRVLAVTAIANSLSDAHHDAYEACSQIHFEGAYYRTDIGWRGIKHQHSL